MKKSKITIWYLFLYLIVITIGCMTSNVFGKTIILTGPENGTYIRIGNDLKNICDSQINVISTQGSVDNIKQLIKEDRPWFAIIQYDTLKLMQSLSMANIDRLKMIYPLYDEEVHLLTTDSSGITRPSDLRGKIVSVGLPGSGTWVTASVVKSRIEGLWLDDFNSPTAALNALMAGQVHAMFCVAGSPVPAFSKLRNSSRPQIRFLELRSKNISDIYFPTVIPASTYPWQPNPVYTYNVRSVLVVRETKTGIESPLVKKMVQNITTYLPELKRQGHPKWQDIKTDNAKLFSWPYHPIARNELDLEN